MDHPLKHFFLDHPSIEFRTARGRFKSRLDGLHTTKQRS
jgi:hypothetical protein